MMTCFSCAYDNLTRTILLIIRRQDQISLLLEICNLYSLKANDQYNNRVGGSQRDAKSLNLLLGEVVDTVALGEERQPPHVEAAKCDGVA